MKKILLLAAAVGCSFGLPVQASTFAYISSPADGLISQYQLDDASGALSLVEQTKAGDQVNPMALSPDGKALFAALRAKPYQVVSFSIEPVTGHLKPLAQAPLAESLAYLSTDRSGRFLMGASYGADLLSVQPIDAQHRPSDSIQTYKTGMHAHSVRTDPSNRFAYAGNLGVDRVLQYRLEPKDGKLVPIGEGYVTVPENTGPRHLAFAPNGKFLYVVGEMSGTVTAFSINDKTGGLKQVNQANGIPERLKLAPGQARDARNNDLKDDPTPRIWAADVRISPDGKWLFTSERTSSSVSVFKVDPATGKVTFVENYPVEEKQPRNIAVAPNGRWLLVTGEKAEKVGSYSIAADGALKRVSEAPSGKGALWIEMLSQPAQ
ncbi:MULTISPECIES: lactonase family protein [Pseudomonas syringae group]|uniref:6-phosphogluconolactonase n=7 Tax=Pseudomonas viridiflava TaxID=33069 RepID=A0A1Y6JKC6_PSEVI|nr:lactonase family protein [Pseudomonas viridiflava]MBD8569416.1 lactonase family protein [Pseudomonas syringae]VVN78861.1 6-phosphogluconolactonase [Pseudomonas fluorescens]MEE4083182.1 lactonase family protein [Pseudomonas viridiflava]MEE4099137.1 lactonase family protein [Pseudomonas viridiflava]MEE4229808.1 lactonase family protein [Pseudomonas viridiflava]